MRNTHWILGLFAVTFLAACVPQETAKFQETMSTLKDPSTLLSAYVVVFAVLSVWIVLFGGKGFVGGLLETIRVIGVLSLVCAPLYYLVTNNLNAGISMGVSGLVGVIVTSIYFWSNTRLEILELQAEIQQLKRKKKAPPPEDPTAT
ncbi:MAG: hypothetical protein Q8P82_01270 [bacterium]|nr:hypothetical protein [bacterium]